MKGGVSILRIEKMEGLVLYRSKKKKFEDIYRGYRPVGEGIEEDCIWERKGVESQIIAEIGRNKEPNLDR